MTSTVSIIIPVQNQWKLTEACLRSLAEHTPQDDIQILVMDNGSTDDTSTQCAPLGAALFGSRFRHIPLGHNRNFGPACNEGAHAADADYLFFLNNDTLLTAGWLPPLLDAFARQPDLGATGPLLLYPDDRVQHAGVTFTPTWQVTHLYQFFPRNHPVLFKKRTVQALTGAALMIPAGLFASCGGFFEEYRNGYEDLDLCAQIRAKGLVLRCTPQSVIYHLTSQTPGRFDSDDHNALLLSSRCDGVFQPDQHRFGTEDGYMFQLSPTLHAILTAKSPSEKVDMNSPHALWSAVNAEPLWAEGYITLFNILAEQKKWTTAFDLLQMEMRFFPQEILLKRIANTATFLKNKDLISSVQKFMQNMREEMQSISFRKKFMMLHDWAKEHEDKYMLGACVRWMKEHLSKL